MLSALLLSILLIVPLVHGRFEQNPILTASIKEAVFSVLVISAGVLMIWRRESYRKPNRLDLVVIVFILFALLSTFFSLSYSTSLRRLVNLLLLIAFYYLISNNLCQPKLVRTSACILTLAGGIVALYGILQYFGLTWIQYHGTGGTMVASFNNVNLLGGFLAFCLPLAVTLTVDTISRWWGIAKQRVILTGVVILMVINMGLMFVVLLLSGTRGAWLGAIGGIVIVAAVMFNRQYQRKRRIVWHLVFVLFVLLALVILLNYVQGGTLNQRFLSIVNVADLSTQHRLAMWQTALSMVRERPLLGAGIGTFGDVHPRYQGAYLIKEQGVFAGLSRYVHNDYLEIAAGIGLPGLVIFLWLLVCAYRQGTNKWNNHFLLVGYIGSLTTLLIHSIFHYGLQTPTGSMLFWFTLGIISGNKIPPNCGGENRNRNKVPSPLQGESKNRNKVPSPLRGEGKGEGEGDGEGKRKYKGVRIVLTVLAVWLMFWTVKGAIADFYFNCASAPAREIRAEEKEHFYRKAIWFNPHHAEARCNLGNTLRRLERIGEAEQQYRKVIQTNPYYPEAHFNLADLLGTLGRKEEAAAEYARAIELNPAYAEAYNNFGVLLLGSGEKEKARQMFASALAVNPGLFNAAYNLAKFYAQEGKWEKAKKFYQHAGRIEPGNINLRYELGVAYAATGMLEEAKEGFLFVLEQDATHFGASYNLGLIFTQQKQWQQAEKYLQQAITLKPDFIDAYNSLGVAYVSQGKLREALAVWDKAYLLNPNHPGIRANRARVRQLLGE